MPTPSLILVPARFKTGKLYTPLATTSGGVVLGASGDFNVTRATTATRFNSAGRIESVASGIPRLDYYTSGGTAGCPALLVEPAATNICLQSEAFNTTWTPSSGGTGLLPVITANNAVSPDGNQTADKIDLSLNSGNTLSDISWIYQNNTLSSGQIYAGSVWLKAATQADVGKVIQVGYVSYQSYTLTADWVRITLTQTPSITQNYSFGFRLRGAQGTANIASLYAWGAQLETGSVATSYIPTTTASATRNAEVISVTGAVSGCIGQTEGTIYWEGNALSNNTNTQDIIFINRNATNSVVFLKTSTTNWVARIYAGGSTALSIIDTTVRTGFLKVAIAYKSGNTTFYINGTKIGSTSTTAFTFTAALDSVVFGHAALLFGTGNQQCRAVALYTTRLSDTELAALTTL